MLPNLKGVCVWQIQTKAYVERSKDLKAARMPAMVQEKVAQVGLANKKLKVTPLPLLSIATKAAEETVAIANDTDLN